MTVFSCQKTQNAPRGIKTDPDGDVVVKTTGLVRKHKMPRGALRQRAKTFDPGFAKKQSENTKCPEGH